MRIRPFLIGITGALMIACGAGALPSAAQAASPAPMIVARTAHMVAIVETVDPTTRQILLSGPRGRLVTLVAGPAVRNFNQIHSGDRLSLTFRRAVAVAVAAPAEPLAAPAGIAGARRAALGAMPGGGAFITVSAVVQIDSIDRRAHTVTFTNAAGEKRTIAIADPALQHFARKLKAGDKVRLDYLQSVSVAVQPGGGA